MDVNNTPAAVAPAADSPIKSTAEMAAEFGGASFVAFAALVGALAKSNAAKLGIPLSELQTGKNAKHFANVVGHSMMQALANQGFDADRALSGLCRGATKALDKMNAPSNELTEEEASDQADALDAADAADAHQAATDNGW